MLSVMLLATRSRPFPVDPHNGARSGPCLPSWRGHFCGLASDHFGLSSPITSYSHSDDFLLMPFFSRSAFRTFMDFIASVLQAILGKVDVPFFNRIQTCWAVGLLIHHLGNFTCKEFAIFSPFGLWHNGGPDYNYIGEKALYGNGIVS